MATAAMLHGLSRPAAATASLPALSTSAWPRPARIDYDAYRAEAGRLRTEKIKDAWLSVGRRLKRIGAN